MKHDNSVDKNGFILLIFLFVSLSLITCDKENVGSNDAPKITGLEFVMAPNPTTPLAGLLELNTNKPTRVSVFLSDGINGSEIHFDELNQSHSLPVLGFGPDRTYTIQVKVIDEEGKEAFSSNDIDVTTDPLPDDFPSLRVSSTPEEMEPGVTLFTANFYLIAVNETGEVVWYHKLENNGRIDHDPRRLSNGNILVLLAKRKIIEVDMLGNIVRERHPSLSTEGDATSMPLPTLAFHHEVFEMGSGNLLVLSVELRSVDNYPTSDEDPFAPTETATLAGDVVVEFSPDGTIVNEWSLLDLLDPLRIGYDSLSTGEWSSFFNISTRDWAHANAVIHDPSDNSIIVSLRHQDALVKFSRETGELIWILGTNDNWDPVKFGDFLFNPTVEDEFFWPFHAHAPIITPEGNILLFDNGNDRASPYDERVLDEENFSRAVEYSIDEERKDIAIVWEYGQFIEDRFFAGFLGDADLLPQTGNVLITFGGMLPARIIEVTHETPANVVFELVSASFIYRSERLPSLYP